MSEPATRQQNEIEAVVAKLLREDASKHREFLESMFKRTTWAIGIIFAVLIAIGGWIFGSSVESAANAGVDTLISQERVVDNIRNRIEATLGKLQPDITAAVRSAVTNTLEQEGSDLAAAVAAKVDEVRAIRPDALLNADLRGPPGERGPAGRRGPPGPLDRTRLSAEANLLVRSGTTKSHEIVDSYNARGCFLVRLDYGCTCSVAPTQHGKMTWTLDGTATGTPCVCSARCIH